MTIPKLLISAVSLVFAVSVSAATINVGFVTLEEPLAGSLMFSLFNMTGAPPCGVPCSPSDFGVATAVDFSDLQLVAQVGGSSETRNVAGPLGPGVLNPPEFEFSGFPVSSALLSGRLGSFEFMLENGQLARFSSDLFSVLIVPATGNTLQAGDFALIAVEITTEVPEPSTLLPLAGALAALWRFRRRPSSPKN